MIPNSKSSPANTKSAYPVRNFDMVDNSSKFSNTSAMFSLTASNLPPLEKKVSLDQLEI